MTYLWMGQQILVNTKAGLSSSAELQRSQENQIEPAHCV